MKPKILGLTKLCPHRRRFFHRFTKIQFLQLKQLIFKKNIFKKTNYHICRLVTPTESGNTVDFKSNQKILIIDT